MKINMLVVILSLFIFSGCATEENNEIEELNFTGKTESSGDFSVFKLLSIEDTKTVLAVQGSGRAHLNLGSEFTEFILPYDGLGLEISSWNISVDGYFTNDVPIENATKLESWSAISGSIMIAAAGIEETEFETYYNISLILENVVFENTEGEQKKVLNLIIEKANVGWLPG